jgi:hypothetical protein
MAFVVNDRVQEFTSTTGTGTLTLTGSPDGFETFSSAVGNGNTTYYTISSNTTEFEVGIGTVGAGTLSRDTVISSSNSDALVNFSAGTKNVFVTLPASKTILLNDSGNVGIGTSIPDAKLEVQTSEAKAGSSYSTAIRITNSLNYGYGVGIDFAQPPTSGASVAVTGAITNDYDSDNNYSTRFYTFNSGSLSEKMRIDSSGKVGIGTSSPSNLYSGANNLVVGGGSGDTGMSIYSGTTGVGRIYFADGTSGSSRYSGFLEYNHSNNDFQIGVNDSTKLKITSAGNVGIGTSSPSEKLEVVGTIVNSSSFLHNVNNSLKIISGGNATNAGANLTLYGGTEASVPGVFRFRNGASESMRIDSSGNLGIGTDSPDAKLSVNGVASFGDGTALLPSIANFGDLNTGMWFPAADTIAFSEGGAEAMRIDSSGNVGIGTTAPTDYYADNLVVNAQSEGGITLIGTSAHENYLAWADGTSGTERYSGYLSYNHSSNFMRFATNGGSERMRITSSGNVGIGTTAPDAKLSVNGVASFGDGTALLPSIANFGDLDTGIFFPAADTIAFSEGGVEAMRITSAGNVGIGTTTPTTGSDYGNLSLNGTLGGQLAFHTGGTGKQFIYSSSTDLNIYNSIAGNLIFHTNSTERMRINSSGNVGIGTSSPDEKLTVSGDMNVVSGSTYKIKAQVSSSYALNIGHDRIQIVNAASNPFLFYYASTEILRITSTGNVGIGTTSPDALLSVNGVASFGDGTALLPSIANFGDLNTGMWFPAEDTIAFSEGGTEAQMVQFPLQRQVL